MKLKRDVNLKNKILDEQSFKDLFDLYFESICNFLNYYTHNREVIEDIMQDIFVNLWENRESLQITHMKTYLYTTARNRVLNHIRDQHNRAALLENWAIQELEKSKGKDCINMGEFHSVLQEATDALPEKCREIYLLSRSQDLSYNEIAKEKNISVKTVEAQMSTALKKIRQHLSDYYKKN